MMLFPDIVPCLGRLWQLWHSLSSPARKECLVPGTSKCISEIYDQKLLLYVNTEANPWTRSKETRQDLFVKVIQNIFITGFFLAKIRQLVFLFSSKISCLSVPYSISFTLDVHQTISNIHSIHKQRKDTLLPSLVWWITEFRRKSDSKAQRAWELWKAARLPAQLAGGSAEEGLLLRFT